MTQDNIDHFSTAESYTYSNKIYNSNNSTTVAIVHSDILWKFDKFVVSLPHHFLLLVTR